MAVMKKSLPILVTVLMAFTVMPMMSGTAYAEEGTEIVIPADVTKISSCEFINRTDIESVTFEPGSKLELIEDRAFEGCTNLTDITIPAGVKEIKYKAFYQSGLESITFLKGSKLEDIGNLAFLGCENLKTITIPASTKVIGEEAFRGSGLRSVAFEKGSRLETISNRAFNNCVYLEDITIPASVTSIALLPFAGCSNLSRIHYIGTQETWESITTYWYSGGQPDVHFVRHRITKATPETFGEEREYCPDCGEYILNTTIDKPEQFTLSAASYTYDGSEKTPDVTVKDSANKIINESDYEVSYSQNVDAGTATATVKFTGDYYAGSKDLIFTIDKAANPLAISPKTATVKYSKLKKKTQTLDITKVMTFTKDANDQKTYTLSSAKKGSKSFKKYFKVNSTTGKVTIKKGLKKGTYKVKVNVTAAGNDNYEKSAVQTVTFKIKVK